VNKLLDFEKDASKS